MPAESPTPSARKDAAQGCVIRAERRVTGSCTADAQARHKGPQRGAARCLCRRTEEGPCRTPTTAVILDTDGLVLTNQHVVDSGGQVAVSLSDGRTAPATVVAQDATADIALLRATGLTGLTPATLGSDSTLTVGDTVLAFGSPLGLAGTVTAGIVSALHRSVDDLSGLVQTDAAINHGNSGGALVDTAGRVVGINVAIATTGEDEGSVGLGFAIPVDTVRQVVTRLTAS
ncbi:trypsin-like peptidase domain-containing protein [Micromonospora matsumotoense]|uniref:S1C family serine protease n=1 Tax=Micromonospora matsumotoense TaxID=121616 RepID=UPI0034230777